MDRIAVVLFNLGGPDSPDSVRPFLFNLFNDSAIISIPQPFRWCLAQIISLRRTPVAKEIYSHIGGKSPLLQLTEKQGNALQHELQDIGFIRTFVCMRYWHPMSGDVVKKVAEFAPDRIVLLPLYPQYSSTTSGSSFNEWRSAAKRANLLTSTVAICCYPTEVGWIEAQTQLLAHSMKKVSNKLKLRVLFSAHGLPKKIIMAGDPYQWHVERTASAIVGHLNIEDLDWVICYQSRVGPLEWIGPSTEEELARAATDGVAVVVLPIAFVSEHSETLVELDIEYRAEASRLGIVEYVRVPAVGIEPAFIRGLGTLVREALSDDQCFRCGEHGVKKICPTDRLACPQ
ncbi:MAG: ferrochelatase [Magnetovibrio sp.]|nr:ferrochelatase [Magnetovibrio sp.]|tara:strand:+ start:1990 stop:3021 length:1032 start_codon:yes stop_codon:yes gene_type:complete